MMSWVVSDGCLRQIYELLIRNVVGAVSNKWCCTKGVEIEMDVLMTVTRYVFSIWCFCLERMLRGLVWIMDDDGVWL